MSNVVTLADGDVSQFASLIIKGLGYDKYQTLLYTSPSGAVQLVLIWIGVVACALFPRNRCAVALVLVIPPLVGCILLLKLPLSASWGVVVASWLVSAEQAFSRWSHTNIECKGILHHGALVDSAQSKCIKHQGQHQAQCDQCSLLHWLLRRLYRLAPTLDAQTQILLWSCHCHCDMDLTCDYNRCMVGFVCK